MLSAPQWNISAPLHPWPCKLLLNLNDVDQPASALQSNLEDDFHPMPQPANSHHLASQLHRHELMHNSRQETPCPLAPAQMPTYLAPSIGFCESQRLQSPSVPQPRRTNRDRAPRLSAYDSVHALPFHNSAKPPRD